MIKQSIKFFFTFFYQQVVYCWEGHKFYIKSVQKLKEYSFKRLMRPWMEYTGVNWKHQTVCKVEKVQWETATKVTPTLCCIILSVAYESLLPAYLGAEITFTIKLVNVCHCLKTNLQFL